MRRALRRVAVLLLVGALTGAASGCTGGGFGKDEPAAPDDSIHSYVALGDGFTAAPYVGKTVDKDCLRSAGNYPALLAADLGIKKVTDVSCTGVATRALTHRTRAPEGSAKQKAQIDAVGADTDLVSIGVGIEDRDLLHRVFDVCMAWPCRDPETRAQTYLRDIARVGVSLAEVVREVQQKAPDAVILLVGYPQITPTDGHCHQMPKLTQDQLDGVNTLFQQINGQIRSVARQTASTYVDVAELSAGHELCSADPWVSGQEAVDGTSVAFHPKAAEQAAVATLMKEQIAQLQ